MVNRNRLNSSQRTINVSILLLLTLALASCNKDSLESEYVSDACEALLSEGVVEFSIPYTPYEGDTSIPVTNNATVPAAITFTNARLVTGSIPAPPLSTGGTLSLPTSVTITDNSSSRIRVLPSGIASGFHISAVAVQFAGDAEYFLIPIDPDAAQDEADNAAAKASAGLITQEEAADAQAFATAGGVYIDLQGPTSSGSTPVITGTNPGDVVASPQISIAVFAQPSNGTSPDYSMDTWEGIDDPALWSETATMASSVVFVGVGVFQVSLTWATGLTSGEASDSGAVDLDLYVTEPDGTTIFYGNRTSDATGGELDTDNRLGFGPENIVYETTPGDGLYDIELEYFSLDGTGLVPSAWTVSVTACNMNRVYNGLVTTKSSRQEVVEFTFGTGCTLPDPPTFVIQDDAPPAPSLWEQALLCDDNLAE